MRVFGRAIVVIVIMSSFHSKMVLLIMLKGAFFISYNIFNFSWSHAQHWSSQCWRWALLRHGVFQSSLLMGHHWCTRLINLWTHLNFTIIRFSHILEKFILVYRFLKSCQLFIFISTMSKLHLLVSILMLILFYFHLFCFS